MFRVLILLVFLFIVGCEPNRSIEVVQKGDFKVEFLFEQDSCKVYRFLDGGRYIYWSNCSGRLSSDYTESHGKTARTINQETIITK